MNVLSRVLGDEWVVQFGNPYHEPAGTTKGGRFAKAPAGAPDSSQITTDLDAQTIKRNLRAAGIELRPGGIGHMIMPDGTALGPVTNRGISNHWEVAIDAGYLPKSLLTNLTKSPIAIVNGLLKKGWTRWKGEGSWEVWKINATNRALIEDDARKNAYFGGSKTWYIDEAGAGVSYRFRLQDMIDNDFDLSKTLRRAVRTEYQAGPVLDLGERLS
jgi:hypothetical protein